MTRQEAEQKILEKMKEIVEIGKQYDENFNYISCCYNNGSYMINNKYWQEEKKIDINVMEGGEDDE